MNHQTQGGRRHICISSHIDEDNYSSIYCVVPSVKHREPMGGPYSIYLFCPNSFLHDPISLKFQEDVFYWSVKLGRRIYYICLQRNVLEASQLKMSIFFFLSKLNLSIYMANCQTKSLVSNSSELSNLKAFILICFYYFNKKQSKN